MLYHLYGYKNDCLLDNFLIKSVVKVEISKQHDGNRLTEVTREVVTYIVAMDCSHHLFHTLAVYSKLNCVIWVLLAKW